MKLLQKQKQDQSCEGCCHLVIHRTSIKSKNARNADKTTSFYVICDW